MNGCRPRHPHGLAGATSWQVMGGAGGSARLRYEKNTNGAVAAVNG